jgi:hypothetical protein
MIVARRYNIRGLGAGSADIPSPVAAGTMLRLPMTQSLTMVQRATATYSPVQLLSALQRYQTQLQAQQPATTTADYSGSSIAHPSMSSLINAASALNTPDVNPGTMDAPSDPPIMLAPGPSTIAQTFASDGSGKLVIPPNPYAAAKSSSFAQFAWSWGPPVVAVTGLLAAIFFLTRKRKGT